MRYRKHLRLSTAKKILILCLVSLLAIVIFGCEGLLTTVYPLTTDAVGVEEQDAAILPS